MIVLDIETSGYDAVKNGIIQIGAVDLQNPKRSFSMKCRIDPEDECMQEAIHVTGISEKQMRTGKKTQKQALKDFFTWCKNTQVRNFVCHNPQFDLMFIMVKAHKYKLKNPFHFRAFDLHSIASHKHFEIHGNFLIKNGYSDMGLPNVLRFCGMHDDRHFHDALEDARLEAECFSRLVYGKGIFKEYAKNKIPDYLVK